MAACMQIQGQMTYWSKPEKDVSEDARNDALRDYLSNKGLYVRDQSHIGYGEGLKKQGNVDLIVIKPSLSVPQTLIEAMNLSSVSSKYIQKHLEKLVKAYNTPGIRELFLVSYVELERKRFSSFWKRYVSTIKKIDGVDFMVDNKFKPIINEELAWIKSIKMKYKYGTDGEEFYVYHICARVAE